MINFIIENDILKQYQGDEEKVVIPENVKIIGYQAFMDCINLRVVELHKDIEEIEDSAFAGCSNLEKVFLHNDNVKIGNCVFLGCENLQVTIKEGLKYWGNQDNPYVYLLSAEDKDILVANVDEQCKFIGTNSFRNCCNLKEAIIPKNVINIQMSAFCGCINLSKVTFNDIIQVIGDYAFDGCENLTDIVFGNNLTAIGYGAFQGCKKLKKLELPNSLIEIGEKAFFGCYLLKTLSFSGTQVKWDSVKKGDMWKMYTQVKKISFN